MSCNNDVSAPSSPGRGFAATLRRIRQDHRLSQNKLAELLGYDHTYISRLESGHRTPSRDFVERVIRELLLLPTSQDAKALWSTAGFVSSSEPAPLPEYGFIAMPDPNGGYVIRFPDCPGCVTRATDYLDVAYQARIAIRQWCNERIESGAPLPTPRTWLSETAA